VVLAVFFGALFTATVWIWGPTLFAHMGGMGKSLAAAILYANLVFLSAIPGWIVAMLAAALRGAGNVRVPAIIAAAGSFVTLLLSPLFILGWGPVPRFGVAGAGIALTGLNVVSAFALVAYLRRPDSPVRLVRARLEMRLFSEILRVGLPSAAGTAIANLTVVVATGLAGTFGRDALAGYGLASRLDYLLIPLLFAIGTATVTMVGTNIGAGQYRRARRIAWIAALASALIAGMIGFAAALYPQGWIDIFTREHVVLEYGTAYLIRVAPFYTLFGAGMALYFANQGAGKMAWPFAASVVRLLVVFILGDYLIKTPHGSLDELYVVIALSYLLFGAVNLFAMASGFSWGHTMAAGTVVEMSE
jgi:Na+-driven multidrug efflux pump